MRICGTIAASTRNMRGPKPSSAPWRRVRGSRIRTQNSSPSISMLQFITQYSGALSIALKWTRDVSQNQIRPTNSSGATKAF